MGVSPAIALRASAHGPALRWRDTWLMSRRSKPVAGDVQPVAVVFQEVHDVGHQVRVVLDQQEVQWGLRVDVNWPVPDFGAPPVWLVTLPPRPLSGETELASSGDGGAASVTPSCHLDDPRANMLGRVSGAGTCVRGEGGRSTARRTGRSPGSEVAPTD